MIVYIPTPITSVEQAEQLPDRTVAQHPEERPIMRAHGRWRGRMLMITDVEVVEDGRWEALVPVEAEEEYSTDRATFAWDNDAIYSSPQNVRRDGWVDPLQRRFTTMWETVTDPDRRGDCA